MTKERELKAYAAGVEVTLPLQNPKELAEAMRNLLALLKGRDDLKEIGELPPPANDNRPPEQASGGS